MGRENVMLAGRAFLVSSGALVDTCKIEEQSGEFTDQSTGVVVKTWTTIYTGPCRFQAASASWAGPSEVAEAAIRLLSQELQLPVVGSEGVDIDARVTCLTCLNDTDLVGRVFSVTGASRKSHATTRKLPLSEVLS